VLVHAVRLGDLDILETSRTEAALEVGRRQRAAGASRPPLHVATRRL
jgi:hypothetical protein